MSKPISKPVLYFAYGSNMCRDQMAVRCPGAHLAGPALLRGHRFAINVRGYGTILPHEGGVVHGALWHLTRRHEQALDRYESVDQNHYFKSRVTLEVPDQPPVQALVYIASDPAPGSPRPEYFSCILNAARALKFPARYLKELQRWEPRDGPDSLPG